MKIICENHENHLLICENHENHLLICENHENHLLICEFVILITVRFAIKIKENKIRRKRIILGRIRIETVMGLQFRGTGVTVFV